MQWQLPHREVVQQLVKYHKMSSSVQPTSNVPQEMRIDVSLSPTGLQSYRVPRFGAACTVCCLLSPGSRQLHVLIFFAASFATSGVQ